MGDGIVILIFLSTSGDRIWNDLCLKIDNTIYPLVNCSHWTGSPSSQVSGIELKGWKAPLAGAAFGLYSVQLPEGSWAPGWRVGGLEGWRVGGFRKWWPMVAPNLRWVDKC